jgi:hypothetical protein
VGLGVVATLAWYFGRRAATGPAWGCGYAAPSPRMQYTGSAFSEQFARLFAAFLPSLRREELPDGVLPRKASHVGTHHFDAVERRMFEMLGQAEDVVSQASDRIPEQSRFAFAAGLVALIVIGAILLGGQSP